MKPKGKALISAYEKGKQAAKEGQQKKENPYLDKRTSYKNGVTFSRAFHRVWDEGFDEFKVESK